MKLYVGMAAPHALEVNLTSDGVEVDLSQVSIAQLMVGKPKGIGSATWSVSMSNATTKTLTLTHTFASDGSDLDINGTWAVYAALTVPGGTLTSNTIELPVSRRFDFS